MISFLSCSHEDDYIEDYLVVDEYTVNDTISNKDSINNTDTNAQNQIIIKKDTFLISYEKYMNISPYGSNGQGGACFDKYYFQGYAGNAAIGVYDLERKTAICKIDILEPATNSDIHVNTMNFGSHRVYENDFFPLLYICSGYTKKINGIPCSFIYVYRIIRVINKDHTENISAELVQTITLKDFGVWTEGIIDNDHSWLWVKFDQYRYASFPLPRIEDGDVVIKKEDALMDFSLGAQPFSSSGQGHLYHDNKILSVSGISPNSQKLAFIVINTISCKIDSIIDLAEIGLRDEPENVFFYKNQLMIGYRTSIYKFDVLPLNDN